MSATRTARTLLSFAVCGALACGEGQPTAAQAAKATKTAAKDLSKAPAEGKGLEPKPKTLADDPTKVELPWTFEQVRDSMPGGTALIYKRSGTDIKGKKVDDTFQWLVRRASSDQVGTSGEIIGGGADQPSGEVAMAKWTKFSPFFSLENPKHELKGREKITVPAGEFDTITVDMAGFFGNRKTVWLIIDKPGVYAKVVEHANEQEAKDKTNLTWELQEITKVGDDAKQPG